jgi:hypothetical protein
VLKDGHKDAMNRYNYCLKMCDKTLSTQVIARAATEIGFFFFLGFMVVVVVVVGDCFPQLLAFSEVINIPPEHSAFRTKDT